MRIIKGISRTPSTRPESRSLGCAALGCWKLLFALLLTIGLSPRPASAQVEDTIADVIKENSLTQGRPGQSRVDLNLDGYHSDNIRRTSTDAVSDNVVSVGTDIDSASASGRLNYIAKGEVYYVKYLDNTFRNQVYGDFDGWTHYELVADHLDWVLRESFDKLLANPAQPATPDNLDTYNYATTGPRYILRLGPSNQVIAELTYSRLDVLRTATLPPGTIANALNLASKRYGALLLLSHKVSEVGKVSLNFKTDRVRYNDRDLNADYNRTDLSVGYDTRISRTTFAAELGDTRIVEQGTASNGLLARMGVTRKISPHSSIELGVDRESADAADIIRNGQGFMPTAGTLQLATHDPLVDTGVNLGWRYQEPRTQFGVFLQRTQERYLVSRDLDRNLTGVSTFLDRRLQPRLGLEVKVNYLKESFTTNSNVTDREIDATAALTWYLTARLRIAFRGEHYDRKGVGAVLTYTENRVGVRFGYDVLAHGFSR